MWFTCLIKCLRSNLWVLTAYGLHGDCILLMNGIQLYMYVSICYQGDCCNACIASIGKKVNQKRLLRLTSPNYCHAHLHIQPIYQWKLRTTFWTTFRGAVTHPNPETQIIWIMFSFKDLFKKTGGLKSWSLWTAFLAKEEGEKEHYFLKQAVLLYCSSWKITPQISNAETCCSTNNCKC